MDRIEDAMRRFDTTSKKRIQKIKFVTQHNYEVEGFISRKPNRYLGSIFVTSIDGRECSQLIQGMPKLVYWDSYHHFIDPYIDIRAKEDGTNIAFCALMDEYNEDVIDVIVKTRGVPGIAEDYCCGNYVFKPKMPTQKVLDKYKISVDEYKEIAEQLEKVLSFGGCGWCS